MSAVTEIAWLKESKAVVFAFLADVANLPKWATEFCESGSWVGDDFIIRTSGGDLVARCDGDLRTGVIDIYAGPTTEQLWLFPVRVLGMPDGRTAVTFTFFQSPGMPDESFARQHASLRKELAALSSVIEKTRATEIG